MTHVGESQAAAGVPNAFLGHGVIYVGIWIPPLRVRSFDLNRVSAHEQRKQHHGQQRYQHRSDKRNDLHAVKVLQRAQFREFAISSLNPPDASTHFVVWGCRFSGHRGPSQSPP
jgi:hypothetical protein